MILEMTIVIWVPPPTIYRGVGGSGRGAPNEEIRNVGACKQPNKHSKRMIICFKLLLLFIIILDMPKVI